MNILKSKKHIKPLSEDDLGKGEHEHGVHGSKVLGFLTPMKPGSTTRTLIPSVEPPHVHLVVIAINPQRSGYELGTP